MRHRHRPDSSRALGAHTRRPGPDRTTLSSRPSRPAAPERPERPAVVRRAAHRPAACRVLDSGDHDDRSGRAVRAARAVDEAHVGDRAVHRPSTRTTVRLRSAAAGEASRGATCRPPSPGHPHRSPAVEPLATVEPRRRLVPHDTDCPLPRHPCLRERPVEIRGHDEGDAGVRSCSAEGQGEYSWGLAQGRIHVVRRSDATRSVLRLVRPPARIEHAGPGDGIDWAR